MTINNRITNSTINFNNKYNQINNNSKSNNKNFNCSQVISNLKVSVINVNSISNPNRLLIICQELIKINSAPPTHNAKRTIIHENTT